MGPRLGLYKFTLMQVLSHRVNVESTLLQVLSHRVNVVVLLVVRASGSPSE